MANPTYTSTKEKYVGSDGTLEVYPDAYQLDEETVERGRSLIDYVLQEQDSIEMSFLKIGAALNIIEEEKLYLVEGLPTFRAWCSGPALHFSYEHATRLIRIVRDLIPVLGSDRTKVLPVSVLKELLPMLTDGSTPEQIQNAYDEVKELSTTDAKLRIRELRGMKVRSVPAIFKATVRKGDTYHFVTITRSGDDGDYYNVTPEPLYIKVKDWPVWESRFGSFIEYQ